MLVDYAFSRPSIRSLLDVGAHGVSRYLSWLPNSKVIDAAEYRSLVAAGLDVVLNWEFDARDFINLGFDAYKAATEAERQAKALGYDGVIYYSVDFNVTAAQWPTVRDRFRAGPVTVHGIGRTGIYGPWDALAWAQRDGVAAWYWQAGMSTSWSGSRNAQAWPGAHLRQRRQLTIGGADCDVNDVIQPMYGQHGGEDMTPDERTALMKMGTQIDRLTDTPWSYPIRTDAANAAKGVMTLLARPATPVPLSADDRAAIVADLAAQLAAQFGGKLDAILARLNAAGQALDG